MGRINDDKEIKFEYMTNDEFLEAHNEITRDFLEEVIKLRLQVNSECKYYLLDSMILALKSIGEERYEKLCELYVPKLENYYPGNYEKEKNKLITELRALAGEYSSDRYLEKLYILSPFSYIDRYLYEHISETEFPAYLDKTHLNKSLQQFIMDQTNLDETKNKDLLNDEYFASCDKEVKDYLLTVASIFSMIRRNIQKGNIRKGNINTLEKLKAVSYFAALYYGQSNDTKNYKEIIKLILTSKGFTFKSFEKKLSFEDFTKDCESIYILHSHFSEYEFTSLNIVELFNSIFIEDDENAKLVRNVFFDDLDIDDDIFSDIYAALLEKNNIELLKTVDEYNSLLEPNTIEYLELCSKIYSLFQKNGFKKDGKIIQSVDDYSVLTHVVACLFNNSDLTEYLKLKGITIDDITKLTGVELNYDEIINLPLNMSEPLISFYSMLEKLDYEYDSYHEIDIDDFIELVCDSDITGSRVLHRLISSKTKISLPNDFYDELQTEVNKSLDGQEEIIINAVLQDLNIDTFKFIQMVSYYYDAFKDLENLTESDTEMASILCALLNTKYYKDGLLFRFLKEKGLNIDSIFKYYSIEDYYNVPSQYNIGDIEILKNRLAKYLYEGNNKGKNRGEITIEDVLSNIYNKEVNKNIWIYEVLDNMGIEQDIFKDLDKKLEEYKKIELTYRYNSVKRYTPYFITFKQAYVIYNYLIKNNDYTEGDINTMKSLSLLVSLLLDDEKYTEEPKKELLFNYFNNGGIDLDIVIDECGYEIKGLDLNNLDYKNVAIENIYSIFSEVINSLEDNLLNVENDLNLISLLFIVRRLFYLEGYSSIFEIIIDDDNIVDKLENSFKYENMEKIELPLDKILKQLKNTTINIPNINPDDIDNVYKFVISGDKILFKYSDYIVRQVDEIDSAVSDYGDKKEVKNMLGGIYIDKPRYGIITRIFNPNDVIRKVDNDALNALSNYLNEYISTLEIQINKYSEIRDVISLYLDAIKVYNDCYSDLLEKMNAKYTTEELDDIKRAKVEEIIGLLNAKVGSFDATYNTMYVYLEQLSNAIKTHLIILNSLKVSKCNIIPILKTSVLFNFSNNSGKEAIVMSNILRDLCKNLIIQDQVGIQDNLALLEKTELPDELMTRLETDIDTLSENAKVYGKGGKK